MIYYYIIDTAYMLELFKVPNKHEAKVAKSVFLKFKDAIANNARLVLTTPVIYEFGNHISKVANGRERTKLANRLKRTIRDSHKNHTPFLIPHSNDGVSINELDELLSNIDSFNEQYAPNKVGLTDISVISTANRMKSNYGPRGALVHIWTRDKVLKSNEPDSEVNAVM